MKINSESPLPSHTKLDWEECFAKIVLEKIDNRFIDIKIKDKPDLVDEVRDIGIEVTSSISKEEQEMTNLYVKIIHNIEKKPNDAAIRIRELGGNIDKYCLTLPVRFVDLEKILDTIKIKEEKLNKGNYSIHKSYYLFVRDNEFIKDSELTDFQNKIKKIENNFNIKYEVIYLYLNGNIIVFNMQEMTFNKILLNKNETYQCGLAARKMVEEAENT